MRNESTTPTGAPATQSGTRSLRIAARSANDLVAALMSAPPCLHDDTYLEMDQLAAFLANVDNYWAGWSAHMKAATEACSNAGVDATAPLAVATSRLNAMGDMVNALAHRPRITRVWGAVFRGHFAAVLGQAKVIQSALDTVLAAVQPAKPAEQQKLLSIGRKIGRRVELHVRDGATFWIGASFRPHLDAWATNPNGAVRINKSLVNDWKSWLRDRAGITDESWFPQVSDIIKARYTCPPALVGQIDQENPVA